MTTTLNIIGAGRVGQTMLRRAHAAGLVVQDVASGSRASAEAAVTACGAGRAAPLPAMRPADLWLIAVPDDRIAAAAAALAQTGAPPSLAVHFSGFHPAGIMAPLRDAGWRVTSLHPVMSFAEPQAAADAFPGALCGIEGDALPRVAAFAETLGGVPFPIRSEAKALYHAAAVFSNNFATVLQAVALEAWREAGVPEDVARALQESLLRGALENVAALGPRDALTGPAARGDRAVLEAQGRAVADWRPEAGDLYALLSAMAERLKTTGTP